MKQLQFNNDDIFPLLGLGTWLSKPNEVYNAVLEAIRAGYRHIDCAYIYGNEKEIGQALHHAFSTGMVKREELFITSKLWNNFHAPQQVEPILRKSLTDLQLDYLDLYLIHWPFAFKNEQVRSADDLISLDEIPLEETWKAMEAAQKKGLTKHIGVSNFNIPKLKNLIEKSEIKPEMNQVELHPYLQQDELVRFCRENGILVTAYSPLGSRNILLSEDSITQNPVIAAIAQQHNCSPAQVILAWGLHRGTAVIPKSVNAERIKENLAALNIALTEKEMKDISALNQNRRHATGAFAVFPGGPYTLKSIWEE